MYTLRVPWRHQAAYIHLIKYIVALIIEDKGYNAVKEEKEEQMTPLWLLFIPHSLRFYLHMYVCANFEFLFINIHIIVFIFYKRISF